MHSLACAAAAAIALFLTAGPAAAQVRPFASLEEMASYKGADRTQRLVEGAKKEGALSMYTSAQGDDNHGQQNAENLVGNGDGDEEFRGRHVAHVVNWAQFRGADPKPRPELPRQHGG